MKVLTCRVQGAVRNLSLVLALPLVCWAENTIEVISSDGTSTNAFSTAVDAFREVPTGGTVRLTADLTDQKTAEISKSCVFDLNGHDLSFAKDQD